MTTYSKGCGTSYPAGIAVLVEIGEEEIELVLTEAEEVAGTVPEGDAVDSGAKLEGVVLVVVVDVAELGEEVVAA